jgi:uncharacterized glyoxalase superfamily protein PhnB
MWGDRTQIVHVYLDDPDAQRAKSAGATILRGPENTPFGARWYLARDLEGALWGFSTYKPQVRRSDESAVHATAQAVALPNSVP